MHAHSNPTLGQSPLASACPEGAFATIAEEWFGRLTNLRASTRARYDNDLRVHLIPRFGSRPISEIGEDDVLALIGDMREAGYSPWSIRHCLTLLRRIFRLARRRELIGRNPVEMLERAELPRVGRRVQRLLDTDSIDRLLAAAPLRYRTLIATAVFTGLRQGELLALLWDDVDLEHGFIHVRKNLDRNGVRVAPKTDSSVRDVVLMPALGELLVQHRMASRFSGPHDFVFASQCGTGLGHRNVAQRGFDVAASTAGFNAASSDKMHFHDLRHTYAALLIGQGANVVFVSRQLGHATPDVTLRVYGHLFDKHVHADRVRALLQQEFESTLGPLLVV